MATIYQVTRSNGSVVGEHATEREALRRAREHTAVHVEPALVRVRLRTFSAPVTIHRLEPPC